MARLTKAQKAEQAQQERTAFYKHWHDQYRRNPKYSAWDRDKKLRALKRRMSKYDNELAYA